MKILQIAPPWLNVPPVGYGGTEAVISNLTEGLINEGHTVTLFATGKSKTKGTLKYFYKTSLRDQNIDWSYALPALLHYTEAFNVARNDGYDMIHTHMSCSSDVMTMEMIAKCNTPSIMTIHGYFPFDLVSNTDKYFLDLYGHKIAAVNISHAMVDSCPKEFYQAGIVHNGVDTNSYSHNLSQNNDYFTWVGKITKNKGLYEAILATKKANEKLIFAGFIEPTAIENTQYFNEKIKPLIDNNQIQYLGPADFKLKNELMKNAKGFLNPIQWKEPFGMVMAESLACGTPVISYANGAAIEIIQDGKNGFLIPESIDSMVNRMKRINEIDRSVCRKIAVEKFSIEAMVRDYSKIYKKVIDLNLKFKNPIKKSEKIFKIFKPKNIKFENEL